MSGPYVPVGIDSDSLFPPEVENRIAAKASIAGVRASSPFRKSAPYVVAALGDSLTANENSAPDWIAGATITNASWLQVGCIQSGERLVYGGNFGVPGESSTAILARVGTVISAAPDICVVLAGRNDGTAAGTLTNIAAICDALLAAGIEPVLATLPPDNATSDTALQLRLRATSAQIRKYAHDRGYRLIDFHTVLVNRTSGQYLSGYFKDATHPNTLGLALMANAFTATMKPSVGGQFYRRPDNTLLGAELCTNGLMDGGTGGIPTGWAAVSTTGVTPSLITGDTRFNNGTAVQLAAASGATPSYALQQVVGITVGHTIEVSWRMALAGQVYGEGLPAFELERGSGVVIRSFRFQTDVEGSFIYRFVADHNTLRLNWRWQFGAMTANSQLRIGEMSVRSLTSLGLA